MKKKDATQTCHELERLRVTELKGLKFRESPKVSYSDVSRQLVDNIHLWH